MEKYRADAAKAREQVRIVADERARLQAVADELRDSNVGECNPVTSASQACSTKQLCPNRITCSLTETS